MYISSWHIKEAAPIVEIYEGHLDNMNLILSDLKT